MTRSISTRRQPDDDAAPASKVVYVATTPFSSDAVDVISPKALDALLEQGWIVSRQSKITVDTPGGGKIKAQQMTLTKGAANRAVARHQERNRGLSQREGMFPPAMLPQRSSNGSFLGEGTDFAGVPGLDVHTNKITGNSYSMGVDAAKLGGIAEDNPFPPGTKPAEEWARGFGAGAADCDADTASDAECKEAYRMGQAAGRGPEDAIVDCVYPPGSILYRKWVAGFEAAGGTVERAPDNGML